MDVKHTEPFFDFTLRGDIYSKTILRFYTESSHVHGFGDSPPKTWDEVYKVYYTWAILETEDENDDIETLFDIYRDECSVLTNLSNYIAHTIDTQEKTECGGSGIPASRWEMEYGESNMGLQSYIKFVVWSDPSNVGYKFFLPLYRAEDFIEFLDKTNKYMLEHSEPI